MAGLGVEVVIEGGLFVEVGFGVGALGALGAAGRVGDLDKALAVEHKARPPAVGDEYPRPVDLAKEEGYYHALLLVRVEAAVFGGELFSHRLSSSCRLRQSLEVSVGGYIGSQSVLFVSVLLCGRYGRSTMSRTLTRPLWGASKRILQSIDLHAAGEPARVIVSGLPSFPGVTMAQKREHIMTHADGTTITSNQIQIILPVLGK